MVRMPNGRLAAEPTIMSRNHTAGFLAGLTSGVSLLLSSPLFAAKTDVVEMRNGDHLTGEIQSLERGLLKFSTDHMGTVDIEWQEVVRVKSDQVLQVESTSGRRLFGQIAAGTDTEVLLVTGAAEAPQKVAIADTVRIAPLEETGRALDRIDGYVDFGFSDTKATDVTQLSFDAGFSFRTRDNSWEFDFTTTQSDSATSESGSATLKGARRHFFGNRWFWSGLGQLDQNDELGLDLRTMAGGTLGRHLVQSNSQLFGLGGGLGLSREDLNDGQRVDSVELILGLEYEAFRFDNPELDLSAQLVVFPSLTVSDRVRGQAQVRLRYELISDLFAELTLTQGYDSKPQSAGAEKNDYTITTSIGYSF
jgi:hypothetical protein